MSLPIIRGVTSEEILHADGRRDVIVKVPLLKMAQQIQKVPGRNGSGYDAAINILVKQFGLTPEVAKEKLDLALAREKEKQNG